MSTPETPFGVYSDDIWNITQSVDNRSDPTSGYVAQEIKSLEDFHQMIENLVGIIKGGHGTWRDTGRAYNFIITNIFASLSSVQPYSDGTIMDYQDSQMNVLSGNLDIMGKGNLSLSDLQSYMNSLMQKTDAVAGTRSDGSTKYTPDKQDVSNFLYILDSMIKILGDKNNVDGGSKYMGADYSGVLNNLVSFRLMFNWQSGASGAPEPQSPGGKNPLPFPLSLDGDVDPLTGKLFTDETKGTAYVSPTQPGSPNASVVIDLDDNEATDPTDPTKSLMQSFNALYRTAQTQADSKAGQAVQTIDNNNNENKTTMGSIGGIENTNLGAITNTQKNTGSQFGEMIKDDQTQKNTFTGNQKV